MGKGKSVGQWWRAGQRKKIIAYNKNDCMLTLALWKYMATHRQVDASHVRWSQNGFGGSRELTAVVRPLSKAQRDELLATRPRFRSLAAWQKEVSMMHGRARASRDAKRVRRELEGDGNVIPMITKEGSPFVVTDFSADVPPPGLSDAEQSDWIAEFREC